MSIGAGGTGRVESRELPQEGKRGFVCFGAWPSRGIQQDPKEPYRAAGSLSVSGCDVEDKDPLEVSMD